MKTFNTTLGSKVTLSEGKNGFTVKFYSKGYVKGENNSLSFISVNKRNTLELAMKSVKEFGGIVD